MYRTPEYRHLVEAEQSLAKEIECPGEKSNPAMLARALVDVIRLKRDIRGVPDPKPVDVSDLGRRKRKRGSDSGPAIPTDTPSA